MPCEARRGLLDRWFAGVCLVLFCSKPDFGERVAALGLAEVRTLAVNVERFLLSLQRLFWHPRLDRFWGARATPWPLPGEVALQHGAAGCVPAALPGQLGVQRRLLEGGTLAGERSARFALQSSMELFG